jgi:hypothetical protein
MVGVGGLDLVLGRRLAHVFPVTKAFTARCFARSLVRVFAACWPSEPVRLV